MKVQIFDADDWKGLYVDGKLYYEGHSIPDFIWAKATGAEFVYDIPTHTGESLEIWGGHCPSEWSEIERVIKDV